MFGEKKHCLQPRNNVWREKTMFEAKKELKNQKSKGRTYRVLFFALGR